MFMSPRSAFSRCEAIVTGMFSVPSSVGALTLGLTDATAVATPEGSKPAHSLCEGDRVLAADGQTHPIKRIMRRQYGGDVSQAYPNGVVLIPRGILGAQNDLYLLPEQPISLPRLLAKSGQHVRPVQMRARALVGLGAIQAALPVDGLVVTRLLFDGSVTLRIGEGLHLACPAARARPQVLSDTAAARAAARVVPHGQPITVDHEVVVPARVA
ncbi:MAG: Hint domain-containing protein [Pseudomonadota bacterium]